MKAMGLPSSEADWSPLLWWSWWNTRVTIQDNMKTSSFKHFVIAWGHGTWCCRASTASAPRCGRGGGGGRDTLSIDCTESAPHSRETATRTDYRQRVERGRGNGAVSGVAPAQTSSHTRIGDSTALWSKRRVLPVRRSRGQPLGRSRVS